MFSALVSVESESELFDAPQPLKLGRIDQSDHQPTFGGVFAQRDDVVNRIAIDALRQFLGPAKRSGRSLSHDVMNLVRAAGKDRRDVTKL